MRQADTKMPSAAGLLFLDPALCERTVFGALDSTVKIAVGKVVDDAAGTAH